MESGTVLIGMVILYSVTIEGRGGDSVHDEYFETEEDAILASALDGENRRPTQVEAMKFSDGSLILNPDFISVRSGPTPEEVAGLWNSLTPAQKLLLNR